MTTAIATKLNNKIYIAADSRLTGYDNGLIVPTNYYKLIEHSEYTIALAGNIQEFELIQSLVAEDGLPYFPNNTLEFTRDLLILAKEFGFGNPDGEHLPIGNSAILVATKDKILGSTVLFGGFVPFENYMAVGNGHLIALGALASTYKPTVKDAEKYIAGIFEVVSSLDASTGGDVVIKTLSKEEK